MARLGFRTSRVAICCLHTALPLIAAVFAVAVVAVCLKKEQQMYGKAYNNKCYF